MAKIRCPVRAGIRTSLVSAAVGIAVLLAYLLPAHATEVQAPPNDPDDRAVRELRQRVEQLEREQMKQGEQVEQLEREQMKQREKIEQFGQGRVLIYRHEDSPRGVPLPGEPTTPPDPLR